MKTVLSVSLVIFGIMVSHVNAAVHEMFPQEITRGGMAMAPQAALPGTDAVRSRVVPLAQARALPAVADQAVYPFFVDAAYTTSVTRVSRGFGGAEIVEGKTEGKGVTSLTVYTPEGVRHEIHGAESGSVYVAVSLPDGTMLMQAFDPSREPSYCGNSDDGRFDMGAHREKTNPPEGIAPRTSADIAALAASGTTTEIDLMMVFDTAAAAWAQTSGGGITALAVSAVSRMNAVLLNSGVDCEIRLVNIHFPDYASNGDLALALSEISGRDSANSNIPYTRPQALADVEARRTACGADAVSLMIDTGSAYGTSGIAWCDGPAEFTFSACSVQAVNISHTMTHEIGHNFGCGHSKTQAGGNSGAAPYAAGLHFTGSDSKRYHTIMAYNNDGTYSYQPCNLFSSPLLTWKDVPAGYANDTDNACRIRERMGTLAGFRPSKTIVTLKFNVASPDETVSPAALVYLVGEPYGFLPAPSKTPASYTSGYRFAGWQTDAPGGYADITENTIASGLVTNAWPQWAVEEKAPVYVDHRRLDDSGSGLAPADAKKTIQAAVDSIGYGEIHVLEGVYAPFSTGNKWVRIRSVGGAERTFIDGGGTQRCATLGSGPMHKSSMLDGFTLRNGRSSGNGGGTLSGTINDCVFTNNYAVSHGGGAAYGDLDRCRFFNNASGNFGGGSFSGTINNSLYRMNTAVQGGGAYSGMLNNCTVIGNNATSGGSYVGGGILETSARNCIVWGNTSAGVGDNYGGKLYFAQTCSNPSPPGIGNIGDDPLFADAEGRLSHNSPCKDAGLDSYAAGGFDLDGNARKRSSAVDMGAYETQTVMSGSDTPVPYSWLDDYYAASTEAQYRSIADNDGSNNIPVWQSYVACLNPTSLTSRFTAGITFTNGAPQITCDPYRPDIRDYEVVGGATLDNAGSWGATNAASRFFRVKVLLR